MNNTQGPTDDDSTGEDRVHRESRHESGAGEAGGHRFDREQAEQEARAAIGDARDELQALLERQKNAAAGQVEAIAEALRSTEDALRDKGQNSVAAYVGHVADRIDHWSGRLRERHIEALGRDIQNLASRQPVLFIAGAVVIGFAATRFLKSTKATARSHSDTPATGSAPAGRTSNVSNPLGSTAGTAPGGSHDPVTDSRDNTPSSSDTPHY